MDTRFSENSFIGKILQGIMDIIIDVMRFITGKKDLFAGERTGEERIALAKTIEKYAGPDAKTLTL
jgi:hypothetical protein